jgi:hypothetical protein
MGVITQAAATLLTLALAVLAVQKAVGPAPPQPGGAGTKFDTPTLPAETSARALASRPTANAGSSTAIPVVPSSNIPACDKPDVMGLSRIVEIGTTGGPEFGFAHFKQYDFLRDSEIVLTFDDGPSPRNTPAVLQALADECLKATFFEIGKLATRHPENHQTSDRGRDDYRHPHMVTQGLGQKSLCKGSRAG